MLTSATRGETLTPNPNECNSMLTSGTKGIYPYLYMARPKTRKPRKSQKPRNPFPVQNSPKESRPDRSNWQFNI